MTPDEEEYLAALAAYTEAAARLRAAKARVPDFIAARKKVAAADANRRSLARKNAEWAERKRQHQSTWPEWLIEASSRVQYALRDLARQNHGCLSLNMVRAAGRQHWVFGRLGAKSLAELDKIVGHWG